MVSLFGLFTGEDRLMRGMSLMLIYIVAKWFLSLVCLLMRVVSLMRIYTGVKLLYSSVCL